MKAPGEELLGKFWETIADKGLGKLLSPWQIGREGRAHAAVRAHEIRMLAQAEADANDLRAGKKRLHQDGVTLISASSSEPLEMQRIGHDGRVEPVLTVADFAAASESLNSANAARSEINASRALLFAEESLSRSSQNGTQDAIPPDNRAIDDDWLFTWREQVGRVTNEDLQRLWGSVLAGEFVNPGRYSLRTLDFLRTLSKSEADLIERLAPFVGGGRIMRSAQEYLDKKGLDFATMLKIQDLGIISGVEAIGMQAIIPTGVAGRFMQGLPFGNKILLIEREAAEPPLQFAAYAVSDLGMQILSLGSFEPDIEYLKIGGKNIAAQGFTVRLADWVQTAPGVGQFFNAVPVV